MAHVHRASLAPPTVVRYWVLGLLAWGAALFVVAGAGHDAPDNGGSTAQPIAPGPAAVIPIHVFEETRLKVLRADMTGDVSALVPVPTCNHATVHLPGAGGCDDPFAGIPGLDPGNGPAPPWLTDLPTH